MAQKKIPEKIISVIIPCYNDGKFLAEAIGSVRSFGRPEEVEIIVVDDGSDDPETVRILEGLSGENLQVFRQENKGLGAARNAGIEQARSDYLLLLDADNRIVEDYIAAGLEVMHTDPRVAVAYSDSRVFGASEYINRIPDFAPSDLFVKNYVDACAVIRKSAWQEAGGFDEHMPVMGYEDWDLWLGFHELGYRMHHIPEPLFHYRDRPGSMLKQIQQEENHRKTLDYMRRKHFGFFSAAFDGLFARHRDQGKMLYEMEHSLRKELQYAWKNLSVKVRRLFRPA